MDSRIQVIQNPSAEQPVHCRELAFSVSYRLLINKRIIIIVILSVSDILFTYISSYFHIYILSHIYHKHTEKIGMVPGEGTNMYVHIYFTNICSHIFHKYIYVQIYFTNIYVNIYFTNIYVCVYICLLCKSGWDNILFIIVVLTLKLVNSSC